jgi:hypothetical protein
VACSSRGVRKDPLAIIGELGPETVATLTSEVPNLGPRASLRSAKGEVLSPLGTQPLGEGPGPFIAPHGISVDSRGDIYVAEVSNTYWPQLFGKKPDHELRSVQKLAPSSRVDRGNSDPRSLLRIASKEPQLALMLALGTGQRQGDCLALPWSAYDGTTSSSSISASSREIRRHSSTR